MRHEEGRTQRQCVRWFRLQYRQLALSLISIPNGYQTSRIQAMVAVAEGLTAGAADLALLVARKGYHGMFIEMKTAKGRQSDRQKTWQSHVEGQGYKYVICRSFDEFREAVNGYLS